MITEHMTLETISDAHLWAAQMGLQTASQERNVANYIWEHKPAIGCSYEEFKAANPEFDNEETFWDICDGNF